MARTDPTEAYLVKLLKWAEKGFASVEQVELATAPKWAVQQYLYYSNAVKAYRYGLAQWRRGKAKRQREAAARRARTNRR